MLCHMAGKRLDSALANMTKESREEDALPVPGSKGEILCEIVLVCHAVEAFTLH